jgi:hypothetical protein
MWSETSRSGPRVSDHANAAVEGTQQFVVVLTNRTFTDLVEVGVHLHRPALDGEQRNKASNFFMAPKVKSVTYREPGKPAPIVKLDRTLDWTI